MFRSIRWTLQLWHACILLLALSSFGSAMYFLVSRAEHKRVDAELEGAARVLADKTFGVMMIRFRASHGGPMMRERDRGPGRPNGEEGRPRQDGPRVQIFGDPSQRESRPPPPPDRIPSNFLWRAGESPSDQPYFMIWNPNGSVVDSSSPDLSVPVPTLFSDPGPPRGDPEPPAILRSRPGVREAIVRGPFGATVLVGRSTRREHDALARLRWILLAAGAAVMAVGLIGGWLLSQRAIRPIRSITETARSITATDLSRRIDVEDTKNELGALARTLNETFERLEASFHRQARFTADASHELRTPLAVIHSHSELALTKERTAEEYRKTIETSLRAAKRMKSLVESLLVLARADVGKLDLHREPLDLQEPAAECLAMVAPLAQERNITLESDLHPVQVDADRTRVAQLMINLLGNAIRYNREGGRVRLHVGQDNGHAVLNVTDTGVGIAEQDQPRVFERFFRADKARSREAGGSGLGLAICQSIVDAHHGAISFTSRPGEGTTFTVRLPATAAEAK